MKYIITTILFICISTAPLCNVAFCESGQMTDSIAIHSIDTLNRDSVIYQMDTLQQTKSLSTWEKYIEPAIAVVSAALVTILFFTVRSK